MHEARGAETSGRGWKMAGAGDVQLGVDSILERRWRAGDTQKEEYEDERIIIRGEVRLEEGTIMTQKRLKQVGREG